MENMNYDHHGRRSEIRHCCGPNRCDGVVLTSKDKTNKYGKNRFMAVTNDHPMIVMMILMNYHNEKWKSVRLRLDAANILN